MITEPSVPHLVNPESETAESPCCTKRHETLTYADLPLSCPTKNTRVWDGHPRVYLPIEEVGKVLCPYCGTTYVLQDFVPPEKPPISQQ